MLKPPGIKRLKLIRDHPISSFAFKSSLCHYDQERMYLMKIEQMLLDENRDSHEGRGLPSSTFRLNVSACCGTGGAFGGCSGDI